jgi:hypothetical protein
MIGLVTTVVSVAIGLGLLAIIVSFSEQTVSTAPVAPIGIVDGYRVGAFYDPDGDVVCYYRATDLHCLPRTQTAYTPAQALEIAP